MLATNPVPFPARIDAVKAQLAGSVSDPTPWLGRITEIESAIRQGSTAASRLVSLFLTYARGRVDGWKDTEPNNRPLMAVVYELDLIVRDALVSLGEEATDSILQAYTSTTPGSPERLWLLDPLHRIGDPKLDCVLYGLTETEIYEALEADLELHMQALASGNIRQISDLPHLRHEARHLLARLRANHELAKMHTVRQTKSSQFEDLGQEPL